MSQVKERGGGGEKRKETFHFSRGQCLSFLRNQTETLATQATHIPSLLPDAIAYVIHYYKVANETESN